MDDLIKKLPIAFPRFGRRKEGTNRGETRDSKDRKDAEEFARGIMLTPTANTHVDKNDRTLELALDQPLGNALESIFSHQGNVLITFPSASDFKVRSYLRAVRKDLSTKPDPTGDTPCEKKPISCNNKDIKEPCTGAPQIEDIVAAAAEDSIKRLATVSEKVLPYFNATANKLIEEIGAVEMLSAALAYISGMTTKVKLLSSQQNAQVTEEDQKASKKQFKTYAAKNAQVTEEDQKASKKQFKTYAAKPGKMTGMATNQQMMTSAHATDPSAHATDPSADGYPDIHTELVDVLVETVPDYREHLNTILTDHSHTPESQDVKAVALIYRPTVGTPHILSVDAQGNKVVYFKDFTDHDDDIDDCSMFIRVIFKIPPTGDSFRTAMIWINYVTLFPIICKWEGNSYKLYSISPRPQSTDSDSSDSDSSDSGSTDSDSTDSDSQDSFFPWLNRVLTNPGNYTTVCLFDEHESAEQVPLSLLDSPPHGRISKAGDAGDDPAIITDSTITFTLKEYDF